MSAPITRIRHLVTTSLYVMAPSASAPAHAAGVTIARHHPIAVQPNRSASARCRRDRECEELRAWRDGDARAAGRLLSRYRRELLGYFRRRAPADAEDLAQLTLLRCIEARERIEDDAAFRYFVYGVAWRTMARMGRRPADEPPSTGEPAASEEGCPERHCEAAERHRELQRALLQLPDGNRSVVELYYLAELKSREIADVLCIPHATVRSRLVRGLAELRRALGELA
jgi:RNA polymerase sigma factor (sigma-70 family)